MAEAAVAHDDWSEPVHHDDWSDPVHHDAPAAVGGTRDNPLDDTAHSAGALTIARASLAPDPQVQIKRYAEAFKQPVTDFGIVGDHIVRKVPETGQYARVEPSVRGATGPIDAAERAFDWVSGGAGPAIPAVMSGVGAVGAGLLATPETLGAGALPAAMAGGAAGGAAGETMRQKLDAALAPKDEEAPMDYGNVAWQGAAGAAGPLGGKLIGAVAGRIAPVLADAAAEELPGGAKLAAEFEKSLLREGTSPLASTAEEASPKALGLSAAGLAALQRQAASHQVQLEQLQKDIEMLGNIGTPVDLSLGQKTGSVVLQQKERQMLRDPATAQDVVDLRDLQNTKQIPGAVRNVLDHIAPAAGQEEAIGSFRTGADAVIDAAKADQSKVAEPLYRGAFKANPSMQSPLLDKLLDTPEGQDAFKYAITRMQNRMSRVANPDAELTEQMRDLVARGEMKAVPGGVAPGLKLETLDLIKQGLWDSEDALRKKVLTGTARQGEVDEAAAIRRAFTNELDRLDTSAASGPNSTKAAGGLYKRAREAFGDPSEDIDAMKNGGIGFIQRMTGQDRQGIITRVFGGDNLLPQEISRMREQFAAAGHLEDWNAGIRSFVESKLAAALKPTQTGEVSNVGGKVYQSLFSPGTTQSAVMRAALGSEGNAVLKRWDALGNVLRAAAHQLAEGSASVTDLQATPVLSRIALGLKMITNPHGIPGEALDKAVGAQNTEAMQKFAKFALTPEGDKILKQLYLQTPASPKAQSLLATFFTQAGIVEAEGAASR